MKKKVNEKGLVLSQDDGSVAYRVEVRKSFWNRIRYGASATAFTALFLAVMLGLNIFVGIASDRMNLKMDLSDNKVFTIDDGTLEFLGGLTEETRVELIVLGGDEEAWRDYSVRSSITSGGSAISSRKYIVETLDRYEQASEFVEVHYVDEVRNPGFFKDRNNLPPTDNPADDAYEPVLIVYSPETQRYQYVRANIFSDYSAVILQNYLNGYIRYVSNPDMQKIAIIAGHGEYALTGGDSDRSMAYYAEYMENNGYCVESVDLTAVQEISSEYQMIVICNPEWQYSTMDIKKISDFLSNGEEEGKCMMVFLDNSFDKEGNPELCNYLSREWGIDIGDGTVFESDPKNALSYVVTPGDSYAAPPRYWVNYTEETATMTNLEAEGNYRILLEMGKTRPLSIRGGEDSFNNINVYTLLESSDTSFTKTGSYDWADYASLRKEKGDEAGPFAIGLLSLRSRYDNLDSFSSSVAVFGTDSFTDMYFITDLGSDSRATQNYVLHLTHFMTRQTSDVQDMTHSKSLLTGTLNGLDTSFKISMVWVVTFLIVPILFLAASFVIWRIRKHL